MPVQTQPVAPVPCVDFWKASGTSSNDTLAIIAVMLAGVGAFFNLFAIQPLLPLFEQVFNASKADVGRTVSAATVGVALSAPFCGALAERVGRRKIIVASAYLLAIPTILSATSNSLSQMVFWRFLQGVVSPGIFGVTIAYITEEWPRERAPKIMSLYISGTVLGGFLGRVVIGVSVTHRLIPFVPPSWRAGFAAAGIVGLMIGIFLWRWLPRDSPLPPGADKAVNITRHFRNPRLVATFAVGFNVLFNLVATFSYITFYLAAPPFGLSPAQLSAIFTVYLFGLVITPLGGIFISRVGSRTALIYAVGGGIAGILMTLIPKLPVIILGLVLCNTGTWVCQAASTSYIQREAQSGERASAIGFYVMFYYIGGSVAGVLPGLLWRYGQWRACVAMLVFVQLVTITIAGAVWNGNRSLDIGSSAHAD
jgi:MFS family permease